MKKEYNKIHERYTELLRSHCDLMERVKIMFGSDEQQSTPGQSQQQQLQNQQSSLSNLAGTFRTNLARFGSQEAEGAVASFQEIFGQRSSAIDLDSGSSSGGIASRPRQAWSNNANFETEMSYDDTTTIIEDVEELQKADKEKDLRDRDHSLSGWCNFWVF